MTKRDGDMRLATVPPAVVAVDAQIEALGNQARELMKGVEDVLLHRLVRRHDTTYRVTRVGIAMGGKHINLSGVRVNGKRVGTREFEIGYAILCEFVALGETEPKR